MKEMIVKDLQNLITRRYDIDICESISLGRLADEITCKIEEDMNEHCRSIKK